MAKVSRDWNKRINHLCQYVIEDTFKTDMQWLYRKVSAHEFGHSIGMVHNPKDSLYIMRSGVPQKASGRFDKFYLDYNQSSLDSIGVRKPWVNKE